MAEDAPLPYSIHSCSSYMRGFEPENILSPATNTASRWTAASSLGANGSAQWIMLQLERNCVVKRITFGKPLHSHPSNVNAFEIHIGASATTCSTLILRATLQDRGEFETFNLPWLDEKASPKAISFIKISPISTHQTNFHPSLWHISLLGSKCDSTSPSSQGRIETGQESTTFRLVAKFLNSHNLSGPCREVLIHAGVTLEHPSVSTLRASVLAGDWNVAEKALASCASNGLLDDIVYSDPPTLSWKLRGHSSHARKNGPSARTMHQLVLDSQSHCLYLLGGWSDTSFKRDFFQYNLETDHWTTLSTDVAYNGGPVTLVLHRMLWAADEGALYLVVPVFGQDIQKDGFLDHSNLSPELMTDWAHGFKRPLDYVKVDGFAVYRWDPAAPQQWKLITTLFPPSVEAVNDAASRAKEFCFTGVFDVVFHPSTRTIYLRVQTAYVDNQDVFTPLQTLLKAFSLTFKTWMTVPTPRTFGNGRSVLVERQGTLKLWNLVPQDGGKLCLTEFSVLDLHSGQVENVVPAGLPDRTTAPQFRKDEPLLFDAGRQEIICFALPKNIAVDNSSADDDPTRVALAGVPPLWVYQIAHNRWIPSIAVPAARPSASSSASSDSSPTLVELPLCQLAEYTSTSTFPPGSACVNCSIPQRRSLQQTVWDAKFGAVYQLGGVCLVHQASNSWEADGQVEGLWMTSVGRLTREEAVRRCAFMLRTQQFAEAARRTTKKTDAKMTRVDPLELIGMLRTRLVPLVEGVGRDNGTDAPGYLSGIKRTVDGPFGIEALRSTICDIFFGAGSNVNDGDEAQDTTIVEYRLPADKMDDVIVMRERQTLLEDVLRFVNVDAREPDGDLVELVGRLVLS